MRHGCRTWHRYLSRRCRVTLPEHFTVEISYKNHAKAYSASFFPGAQLKDENTILFETASYHDVLRLFLFVF